MWCTRVQGARRVRAGFSVASPTVHPRLSLTEQVPTEPVAETVFLEDLTESERSAYVSRRTPGLLTSRVGAATG